VTINTASDQFNHRIGVVKDFSSIQLFADFWIKTSDLITTENDDELYSELANGMVDCIAYSEIRHQLIVTHSYRKTMITKSHLL